MIWSWLSLLNQQYVKGTHFRRCFSCIAIFKMGTSNGIWVVKTHVRTMFIITFTVLLILTNVSPPMTLFSSVIITLTCKATILVVVIYHWLLCVLVRNFVTLFFCKIKNLTDMWVFYCRLQKRWAKKLRTAFEFLSTSCYSKD